MNAMKIILLKVKKYEIMVSSVHTHTPLGGGYTYITEPICGHEECREKFMNLIYPDGSAMPSGFYHIDIANEPVDELFLMDEPERIQ